MAKWIWGTIFILVIYNLVFKSDESTQPPLPRTSSNTTTTISNYPAAKTFSSYECSQDCSGHQAGYDWAGLHVIDDEDDCHGNSESFIEGCKAYVEENNDDLDNEENDDE